ncbi:FKBP-type peptidyl-prolyl cis-trans isomerase [Candidatus Magnetaquicoccus inordinatus]|uniref:FKBP-type peptidyl-prolyl cis-trans isomerase n=1 Tax=Candidatus Magnetaquicoccus inordinatus TaxID=2496818 RepID=UPI00102C2E91|nr:FKBP-type peptidyl-prolyl cis-trans isomerase [Candidatus Magnetaquicoccus inordinatus]
MSLGKFRTILFNFLLGRKRADYHEKKGTEYQKANAQRPGVSVSRRGLQWEVLRDADGPKPDSTSQVLVHYRGTLINGVEFDSSYARNQPLNISLMDVISGWREGLQMMSVGSHYRFVIPPDLAYGVAGAGLLIAGNSTLIFEVELLEIPSS